MISDIAPFFPHTPHITILTVVTLLHSVKLFPLECSYSGSPAMQNSACCMQRLHWALYLKAVMIMAGADVYVCMLSCFSHDRLFVTLWTVAHQAPLSMIFFRTKYWSGLPCPPSTDLPDPVIKPGSPVLQRWSRDAFWIPFCYAFH